MTNKIKVLILVPPSKYSKNVARDLVYGCWCKGKRIAGVKFPPISLALAATVLRESGLSVSLVDAAGEGLNLEEVRQLSKDFDFCVILTSSMTLNEDADFLAELKKINPKLKTIVFGGHATAEPRSTLTRKGIDIVVRREPEYILRDLLLAFANNQDWRIVKGIAFMDGVSYVENDFYPLIENLDDLPIPDRG